MQALDRVNGVIQKILQGILGVICMVLLVVNVAQITGRYVFFYSLPWSEELSTYLFIWVIFLGMHLLVREDAELRIDALASKNKKRQLILDSARDVISLVTIGVFFVSCILMIQNAVAFPRRAASFPVNTYIIYSVMPVGYALIFFQKLTNLIRRLMRLKAKKPPAAIQG